MNAEDTAERNQDIKALGDSSSPSCLFFVCLRRGAVTRLQHLQIHEPGPAVELRVHGVNEPWLFGTERVGHRLEHDDAGDGFGRERRAPAQEDGVAVVPDVQLLEGDGGL